MPGRSMSIFQYADAGNSTGSLQPAVSLALPKTRRTRTASVTTSLTA